MGPGTGRRSGFLLGRPGLFSGKHVSFREGFDRILFAPVDIWRIWCDIYICTLYIYYVHIYIYVYPHLPVPYIYIYLEPGLDRQLIYWQLGACFQIGNWKMKVYVYINWCRIFSINNLPSTVSIYILIVVWISPRNFWLKGIHDSFGTGRERKSKWWNHGVDFQLFLSNIFVERFDKNNLNIPYNRNN